MSYKKIFYSLYIFSFLISIPVHAEDIRIKWIELVPKYAYSFVPETGELVPIPTAPSLSLINNRVVPSSVFNAKPSLSLA